MITAILQTEFLLFAVLYPKKPLPFLKVKVLRFVRRREIAPNYTGLGSLER
jgi:hypothetical protein